MAEGHIAIQHNLAFGQIMQAILASLESHPLVFVLSLAEGQANPKVQARRAGLLGRAVLRTAILSWSEGPAVVA